MAKLENKYSNQTPEERKKNVIAWRKGSRMQTQWKLDYDSERGTFSFPPLKRVLLIKTLHRQAYVLR